MVVCITSLFLFLSTFVECNKAIPIEAHDLHLSKTEIRFKPDQSSIQISMHIFIDDLETGLKSQIDSSLHIGTQHENVLADIYITEYIQQKFDLKRSSEKLQLQFIGKELSDDMMAVWCYFEITEIQNFESLNLRNELFHDLFNDQKNIITFYLDQKNISFDILDKDKKEITLSYQ